MKFYVNKQALKPMLHSLVAADTMNYLEAQVIFQSDDWDGLEKWLRFQKDGTICDFKLNEEDCVTAAAGMNLSSGQWQVSVYGFRQEDGVVVQRITTEEAEITVKQSGMVFNDQPVVEEEETEDKEYITEESRRVADLVMSRQNEDSFALAFLADMHCGTEYEVNNKWSVNDEAVEDAGLALAELLDSCMLDGAVLGGDLSVGSYKSTCERTKKENSDCTAYLRPAAQLPMLYLQGNHDDAPYMAAEDRLTDADLYTWFNRKNLLAGAVLDGQNKSGNYGYLDFDSRKVRVIFLNTDEKLGWDSDQIGTGGENNYLNAGNISARQLDFLANTALDLSDKEDLTQWAVIVCSHRPLNESAGTYTCVSSGETHAHNVKNASAILNAYISGDSGKISHNGESMTYDFSALSEKAGFLLCIHGHNHRYCKALIGTEGILSVGCPNAMNGRERVSDDGKTYTKTAGTAESTAFCVITLDRKNKMVYADHYGAGVDRQWAIETTESGGDSGDSDDAGGDSTVTYTNLIPLSVDTDGSIYNSVGYLDGVRMNSSGEIVDHAGYATTGFMPCSLGDVIYLKNIYMVPSTDISGNLRISFFDADKNFIGQTNATGARGLLGGIHDETDGNLIQFTVQEFSGYDIASAKFFRLCSTQLDGTSVITANEEIV